MMKQRISLSFTGDIMCQREQQQYADEFRLVVNAFLDRPPETPAAPQAEYTLALNGKKQQPQRNQ